MDAALRIVTRLPLQELWREDGFTTPARGRWLAPEDIRGLLRLGRVQFVVVDLGHSPRWIPIQECYEFWKNDAQTHLASPDAELCLEDCPDGYFYIASEWSDRDAGAPIVVLEKSH